MEHGCGQCKPCRINRRRLWTTRLIMESFMHSSNLFVTLTYAPEELPAGGNLVPRHARDFIRDLRYRVGKLRYFIVGEYGGKFKRPHYHALLFGVSSHDAVRSAWQRGRVHIGTVTPQSASYCTGYCVKAFGEAPEGLHKEFARMSLKPGIGATALPVITHALRTGGTWYIARNGDVPREIRIGGKAMDIGRYLVNKLRCSLDLPAGVPPAILADKQRLFAIASQEPGEEEKRRAARLIAQHQARYYEQRIRLKGSL